MGIVIGALIGGALGHFYMRYKANTAQLQLDAYAKKLVAQNIIDEKDIEEFKKSFAEQFSY